MTVSEFSDQFDTLVIASYRRFKNFDDKEELDSVEFNEYEKSVFLTQAQEELVVSLYSGRNTTGRSFEETEELREYLAPLVSSETISAVVPETQEEETEEEKHNKSYVLPPDLLFIVYETASVTDKGCGDGVLDVVPVTLDEYNRIKRNPFRGANGRRVLRTGPFEGSVVNLHGQYTLGGYNIKYIRRPQPIVLVDLPNDLTIGHTGLKTECELPEVLHRRILEMAVNKGLISKFGGGSNTAANKTDKNKN